MSHVGHKTMLRSTLTDGQDIEMTKPLSKLFEEARAACVEWEGQPLYGLYEMPAPAAFRVEFLSSVDSPVQGLTLKVSDGVLEIDGVEAQEMLLWRDTAPNRVPVKVKSESGRKVTLKIWNVWRGKVGGHDVTQAWLGNSGMRIEQTGTQLTLRCSDGEGPVNFDDLAVHLTVIA